jgi:hypothetical protein
MSFYRNNWKNDNYREQPFSKNKLAKFQVSNKSFQSATIISSLSITVFIFILFILKINLTISESDIQIIGGITAGLCGFALAIPLFLKDFDISSNFWRQFYLIAITFLIATFIAIISFLLVDDSNSINVIIFFWFFLSISFSVNINTINVFLNKTKLKLSLNPILNFSVSCIALFLSLYFSEGYFWVYATIIFTIYGFYLTLTLMLAILVELFLIKNKTEDNDTRIKKAIQHLIEKYIDEAFDEQTLLDKLKTEAFSNEQEIISRTKIQELVAEMDSETSDNGSKIVIYDHNKIIPRWRKEYDAILDEHKIIIFIRDEMRGVYGYSDELKIKEKEIEEIYELLSKKLNLSVELLKENNCISKYYLINGKITFNEPDIKRYHILLCLFIIKNADYIEEGKGIYLDESNDIEYLKGYNSIKEYINYPIEITSKKSLSKIK